MSPALAAAACAALAVLALAELVAVLRAAARRRAPGLLLAAGELVDAALRIGREGREPGGVERRRLLVAAGLAAAVVGSMLAGPRVGLALGAGGPWLAGRVMRARRDRYRRAVEAGAPAIALALADALGAGHSLRAALARAGDAVPGAAGHELRRTAGELALGAATDEALTALARRARCHPVDVIVAACALQRRAGGDLARLLRELAAAFEDHARVRAAARAATAQSRFTAGLVVALPAGAAALAELASPGFSRALAGSPLALALVATAAVLQAIAWVAIRRVARVPL